MRLSWGKCIVVSACASLFVVLSCEKHQVGEEPKVQKEKAADLGKSSSEPTPEAPSPTPSAKPTPAEFFPTKP
jgi:hypothetical protein